MESGERGRMTLGLCPLSTSPRRPEEPRRSRGPWCSSSTSTGRTRPRAWCPTVPWRSAPRRGGQAIQLRRLREGLQARVGAAEPRGGAHGRAALPLWSVRGRLQTPLGLQESPAGAQRRAAARLRRLRQALQASQQPTGAVRGAGPKEAGPAEKG